MNATKTSKKNGKEQSANIMYGKIPPQAKDLEEAIIGAILLEKAAYDTAIKYINADCFYVNAHKTIFQAIQHLNNNHEPVDLLTVVHQLQKSETLDEVGGPYAVTRLTNNVTSSAHIEAHCRIVYEKYVKRKTIEIAGNMLAEAFEDDSDCFDLIDHASNMLSTLAINDKNKSYIKLDTSIQAVIERIDHLRNKPKNEVSGISTGIPTLDNITDGWQPTDLIILAARPAVGKSAVAANLARLAAANPNKPTGVGIFSLEMSHQQWTERILSAASDIFLTKIKKGHLDDHEYNRLLTTTNNMLNLNIHLDDSPNLNILTLKAKARQMVFQDNVKLIILDYLQLMNGDRTKGQSREQEVSAISRGLKHLAKELKVPIIALSQISRESDKSGTPNLASLRESGAIEQDADMVIFLIPPSEADINNGLITAEEILIKIAKHRNGPLAKVIAAFNKQTQKINPQSVREEGKSITLPTYSNENDQDLPF